MRNGPENEATFGRHDEKDGMEDGGGRKSGRKKHGRKGKRKMKARK
jgi:hypothetical protein